MRVAVILCCIASTFAVPTKYGGQRIVGGTETTINSYPFLAALLVTSDGSAFIQSCGGSILNERAILTAAHCFHSTSQPASWRVRVGSTVASSGGSVHNVRQIINHPNYSAWSSDSDITVMRLATNMVFSNVVRQGSIAGVEYNPADNQPIWAVGWGFTTTNGPASESLRHVELRAVNQEICKQRYGAVFIDITPNMMCTGLLDIGGRDACSQDSGGPQLHNNVIVGVTSFGVGCGDPQYPGVVARVSRFTDWILINA